MPYFIFTYNILLIVLYTIAATAFLISYLRLKDPIDGWVALLFALFIVDNSIIYMTEIIKDASGIFSSAIKGLILCSFLLCYGQGFRHLCNSRFTSTDYICYAAYIAATFITPSFIPENRFATWLCLSYVWIMLGYVLSRAYQEAKKSTSVCTDNIRIRINPLYISGIAFVVAAMLENWIKVFLKQEMPLHDTKIYTRNVSEDIYSVYIIALALWYLFSKTSSSGLLPVNRIARISDASGNANELDSFAGKYKITPRETEVLTLLVTGCTNQQISETLFISLGTTKNHVHSIYQKCGVTSRRQLIRLIGITP